MSTAVSDVCLKFAATGQSLLNPTPPRSAPAHAITRASLALILCIGLTGCAAPKPPPNIVPGQFASPAVSLDSTGKRHQVLIEAPSPGWVPSLDQSRADFRTMNVYVSLRKPNPAYMYPQVMTTLRVATDVPKDRAITVYMRTLEFNAAPDVEDAYQKAAESAVQ